MVYTEMEGTSSRDDEVLPQSERPLKKARYMWQVKGNYHLKKPGHASDTKDLEADRGASFDSDSDEESAAAEESNNNSPLNEGFCVKKSCLNILINSSESIMDSLSTPEEEALGSNSGDDVPVSLVRQNPRNQDFYLRKWQARQVAKGFVDNTINKVLENWMIAPFDASDFVENCDTDGLAENEGILMAIQSHGLQSGSTDNMANSASEAHSSRPCTCPVRTTANAGLHLVPFHRRQEDDDDDENFEAGSIASVHDPVPRPGCRPSIDTFRMDEHADFLAAAVAVAIEKKGLSSHDCQDFP